MTTLNSKIREFLVEVAIAAPVVDSEGVSWINWSAYMRAKIRGLVETAPDTRVVTLTEKGKRFLEHEPTGGESE